MGCAGREDRGNRSLPCAPTGVILIGCEYEDYQGFLWTPCYRSVVATRLIDPDRLPDVNEVAALFGVSVVRVGQMTKAGELMPVIRRQRCALYDLAAIEAEADARRHNARTRQPALGVSARRDTVPDDDWAKESGRARLPALEARNARSYGHSW